METLPLFILQVFFAVTSVYAIALTKVVQAPRSNSITGGHVEISSIPSAQVNISNVWTLPEEGYSVFFRYFRDRVTWFEADAVCQFHHAQLVTVDSNTQFDAMRAFLKELDVPNNVWIGLKQSKPYGEFLWTDFKPLTNQEHWNEAASHSESSVCVASDPAADFRWHGFNCGGPEVASFICEIPVPDWADRDGCLPTALPSLTVTYLPEQSAVELISDCGLDGTRRVVCQGHRSREEIMKELSCESATESPNESSGITFSNDLQMRHRRDTIQPSEATPTTVASTTTMTAIATKKATLITKSPVKTVKEEPKMPKSLTKAAAASVGTKATIKGVTNYPTTGATKPEKPIDQQPKGKVADSALSLDSTEDVKDGAETPQEMSIAEEPITTLQAAKVVAGVEGGMEVSSNHDSSSNSDVNQIRIENKSVEIDAANSNLVQKVTESFAVLKPVSAFWPVDAIEGNAESSLASEQESIEDLRNLKKSGKNIVVDGTTVAPKSGSVTTKAPTVSSSPKTVVSTAPKFTSKPDAMKEDLSKAPVTATTVRSFVTDHKSFSKVMTETTSAIEETKTASKHMESTKKPTIVLPTTSHLNKESHEDFGEKTAKKVKKTILGPKMNNLDVTTVGPKHESIQTTSTRFISKNLPPVLLYNKNENEQRETEQVLTPGIVQTTQYNAGFATSDAAPSSGVVGKSMPKEALDKSKPKDSVDKVKMSVADKVKLKEAMIDSHKTKTKASSIDHIKLDEIPFNGDTDEILSKDDDKPDKMEKMLIGPTNQNKEDILSTFHNIKKFNSEEKVVAPKPSESSSIAGSVSVTPAVQPARLPPSAKPTLVDIVTHSSSSTIQNSDRLRPEDSTTGLTASKPKPNRTEAESKSSLIAFTSDSPVPINFEATTKLSTVENTVASPSSTEKKPSEITSATEKQKTHPDFLEATDPDVPERPNRGRLLIHPQHHSFYPYFLNRVLG